MAYVTNRRGLQRTGFRPYGETNTFAASQLSGLGQNRPFSASGGWRLHGLGDIVPNGAIVTYTGKWGATYTESANDVISKVSGALASEGLQVVSASSDAGFLNSSIFGMTVQPGPFNVRLQIYVANAGYGDPSDIISVIAHEVFQATGQMPISQSMPSVKLPSGSVASTGQPDTLDQVAADPVSWLEQNAVWIGVGVLALLVIPDIVRRVL